jgi:hypothetical protein
MKKALKSKLINIGVLYLLLIASNTIFAFIGKLIKTSGTYNSIIDFVVSPLLICFLLLVLNIRTERIKYMRLYLFLIIFYASFLFESLFIKSGSSIEFLYALNVLISQLHAILIHYSSTLNLGFYRNFLFWLLSFTIIPYLHLIIVLSQKINRSH